VKYTIPIKEENDDSLSIRLPSSLKERLEIFAEDNEVKANALVRHILEQFLDAQNA
jgi:predicted DNA-binding protein